MIPPPTTTTSALSGSTAASLPTDEPPRRLALEPCTALVDRLSAEHRAHDAPAVPLAHVRAGRVAVEQLAGLERPGVLQVDEHQVGVAALREPALAGEREARGGTGGRDRRHRLERQAPAGVPLLEQEPERRLAAG